jgi:GNAT acetyltransferase-like protein
VTIVTIKGLAKNLLRPIVLSAWPAVEAASSLGHVGGALKVRWSHRWDRDLDEALDHLPPFEECTFDLYRELVQPTAVPKHHALVLDHDAPVAVISLRRCKRHWEPVSYQCLPKRIAPARSYADLDRALNALGVEVRIPAGIGPEIAELHPRLSWSYQWYKLDLQGDYEEHWRAKKRMYTIRRARKNYEKMERRIDAPGDLEWIVEQWRQQWADDPGQEIVATEDRLRFWRALVKARDQGSLHIHTLVLLVEGRRVAGVVFTSWGDTAMLQCGGRDPELDDSYTAAAVHLGVIDWASSNGVRYLDMAGGDWKRLWAPDGGVRHGAIYRPAIIDALSWAHG